MAQRAFFRLLFLLIMPAFACATPTLDNIINTPSVTPTPMGDTLTFNIPIFSTSLNPGQKVQGADLEYVGANNGAFAVKIGGLDATRRTGDSFSWRGVIAPSVVGNYNLRLTTAQLNQLGTTGSVSLSIFNPEPAIHPDFATATANTSYYFDKIDITYLVPEGRQVPGTDLVYAGIIEPASSNNFAQTMIELTTSGTTYPYHAIGDSVVWQGQLRPNIFVRQSLRLEQTEEYGVRLNGTAELWINQ